MSKRPSQGVDDPAAAPVSLVMVATVSITIRGFLVPYARHFRALGWRVEAAANGATRDPVLLDEFDRVHELALSRSVLDLGGLARTARSLSDIIRTEPSIVHVHTPIAAFITRMAIRRESADRRPAVAYTAHGFHFHEAGHPLTNAAFLTAERVAGRWTDRLIVINDEDEAAARRHRIVPGRRLIRMPGIGIDTAAWSPTTVAESDLAEVRSRYGVQPGSPLFVILGELSHRKRQADAIAALASMRNAGAHLLLLGEGPKRAALEATVVEFGLRGRVHLPGFVGDVRPAVRASTALILPSDREGLARSIMEGLALGVPVIASAARGNRELVGTDGGIVVPIGDVSGLAEAMDRLVDHPDEAQEMGRRGQARMVRDYDLQALIRMHETLYRGMLADRDRR